MVWITMSLAPHVGSKKRKKSESKPHSQINKCLNEKRRREQENIHIEELAELVSASPSDMSSLSCKPDKCAILKETVNQIRSQKQSKSELCDDLQQSEVSSSKPNIINNHIFGSILLEALEGFLFVVSIEGKVEFVSENIASFLKYHQDEVYEKNIYDFIHPDDRARFNSNLLLMMPLGNGRDWSSDSNFNSAGKPTKHFNCRFLVKSEEPEIKMENKQPQISRYENLNITANYIPLGEEGNSDVRNGLTCIARRVAVEDKRQNNNKVEQFTTRLDRDVKVVDLDISMLSPGSGQFLQQELLGSIMLDLCHPSDLPTFKQHIKETFESGAAVCVPYKFRIGPDRYAKVKTKSKRFQCAQAVGEFIISTHSVIRDCDSSSALETQKNSPSPSLASTSSGSGSVSDSSSSINGSIALSPLTVSNSYGSYSASLSGPSNSEFGLGDLVLDMFPSSSWALDPNSSLSKESDCTSAASYVSSPQAAPPSNRSSETSAAASPTNSAFISGLASSRSGSSAPSPAMQSRATTPFGSCYSPSASQSSSGKSSPPRALPAKADSLNCSSTETSGINSLSQGIRQDRQFDVKSNQKLRNLLTQNVDDNVTTRPNSRQTAPQDEVTILSDSRVYDEQSRVSQLNVREALSVSRTPNNVILRDLLNQDDDDSDVPPVEPIDNNVESSVPNPLLNAGACKVTETGVQQRLGNNNMLRKLLNNDDVDRNYRKSQDLIHQLLIASSGNKASPFQNEKLKSDSVPSSRNVESSVPKQVSIASIHGNSDITVYSDAVMLKRKSDKNAPNTSSKRQNVGGGPHVSAHLAGQNPMLASMLAQTPRTPPSVPTSVASSIMTQLPQERLPKNLEKKLVHTPYTATSASGTSTSTQAFSQALAAASSVQRDIVTSDARGHILQTSQIAVQPGFRATYTQQQGIIDRLLSGSEDNLVIARSLGLNFSTGSNSVQTSPVFVQQVSQTASENSAHTSLADILNDAALVDVDSLSDTVATTQSSDPVFAEILEQIYSLQEDHNVETPRGADDRATILKLLGDVIDTPQTNVTTRATPATTAQDINEKIAISAIQKELMEGSAVAVASRTSTLQNSAVISTYSQAGRSGTQVSGTPVVQTQLSAEQILLLQQQQLVAGSLPPNYSLVANRIRLPVSTQPRVTNNQELLLQAQQRGLQVVRNTYVSLGSSNVNQIRNTMKQRLYLQQQQKRLLEQQQKQQLTMQTQQPLDIVNSPGTSTFAENMNDLLNNTVAPNVTLLRSSGIPEVPGGPRFITIANPVPSPTNQTSPTPAQLSPGQRCNPRSPFSPLSQQQFSSQTPPPSSYQPARVSPHPPPSYPQGGPSHSPSPVPPTGSPHMVVSPQPSAGSPQWNQRIATSPIQNLQLQNPMLNAQLSQQAAVGANQIRLSAQQRQQLALRSVPSPTSVQGARNAVFSPQSDTSYNPLSPVMVLQSQGSQQQRIQRSVSGPGRITTGSQSQSSFTNSEPVLSPQSLHSPSFTQPLVSTPASNFVSSPSPGVPLTYSIAQSTQHFTFDRQNIQVLTTNPSDSGRSSANIQGSELVRQELRSVVNSRNQQIAHSSSTNQPSLQTLSSSTPVARVLSVQSLPRETLEELGLSIELISGTDAQTTSQALYSQSLLSGSNNLENTSQSLVTSPRVQVEEPKPADQKKSLLQQLLSEPT